uniref:Uncharacterized protein n=1 Tax=Anopheles merus TaxID=30066 RepID=A0A182UQW1_ANOME
MVITGDVSAEQLTLCLGPWLGCVTVVAWDAPLPRNLAVLAGVRVDGVRLCREQQLLLLLLKLLLLLERTGKQKEKEKEGKECSRNAITLQHTAYLLLLSSSSDSSSSSICDCLKRISGEDILGESFMPPPSLIRSSSDGWAGCSFRWMLRSRRRKNLQQGTGAMSTRFLESRRILYGGLRISSAGAGGFATIGLVDASCAVGHGSVHERERWEADSVGEGKGRESKTILNLIRVTSVASIVDVS